MKEVLIIGCGNIGALYDIDGTNINTHAKALSKLTNCKTSVFDTNKENVKKTLRKFNFNHLTEIHYNFDIIIIATPTHTHFNFLKKAIKNKVPIVICEKPISLSTDELNEISDVYKNGKTKIFINYIRQFLPEYIELKKTINKEENNKLVKVCINYTRGFINNASHAFNLLHFLLSKSELNKPTIYDRPIYELEADPTVSMQLFINKTVPCIVNGLAEVKYNFFEIELFFEKSYVKISNSGNKITYKKTENDYVQNGYKQHLSLVDKFKNDTILDDYMLKVFKTILNSQSDNFIDNLNLNQKLIKIISNVKTSY